ncbi:hypothetical protein OH77DRAFT_1517877 [Trametes cingulata]|nr:hypothetical protein OH77DRAFT_1517877 [Trametes cingulata]
MVPPLAPRNRYVGLQFKRRLRSQEHEEDAHHSANHESTTRPRSSVSASARYSEQRTSHTVSANAAGTSKEAGAYTPSEKPKVPLIPPTFWVTEKGRAPFNFGPFEGKVAARDLFSTMVITTPNMDYVPEFPVERRIIDTFADGCWGLRKYSRWPQMLVPDMIHIACIPREPRWKQEEVLWEDLHPSTHWEEDPSTGVQDMGYLREQTRKELTKQAEHADNILYVPPDSSPVLKEHAKMLHLVLRQVKDRINQLPSSRGVAIAVAAHVQRLCLEIAGIVNFVMRIAPRLKDDYDCSIEALPYVGTFVREGTAAQTCHRVGLPTWFLQPLTHQVKVWKIVEVRRPSWGRHSEPSQPPIVQSSDKMAGVLNLTDNWLSTMALSVSKLVCGTRLHAMVENSALGSSHLGISFPATKPQAQPPPSKKKKKTRSGRKAAQMAWDEERGQGESAVQASAAGGGAAANGSDRAPGGTHHPSRWFCESPFYSVPEVWRRALSAASPVPQPASSVTYFYPPPFLLDTVSSLATVPDGCEQPELARKDEKVHRYLHNLVRIRNFCRARLFDPTMTSHPLTIAEWRAALWGDYEFELEPAKGQTEADVRRGQRRQDERNGISRLFGRTALLPSYTELSTPSLDGKLISLSVACSDPDVRAQLIWESHETNFRCELMALDTALVNQPDWSDIHRWEREAEVSSVWGPPSTMVSVIPPSPPPDEPFRWSSEPPTPECYSTLRRFIAVVRKWPGAPHALWDARHEEVLFTDSGFRRLLQQSVDFYVHTFVSHYYRLPIPPIPYPSCAK